MRVGLLARADDRGLGHMTWEFHRHVQPERTLVVREPGAEAKGFTPHLDRYPGCPTVTYDGGLPEQPLRWFLDGLDVLYSAETFYDPRVPQWAADAGVATVLHAMPEFWRPDLPEPTMVWAPTPWRMSTLPDTARLVPVPVAGDRFPLAPPELVDGPLRVLHVAGHRAAGDRNGTTLLLEALRRCRQPIHARLLTQDVRLPTTKARHATVTVEPGGRAHYWDLYADADVLVMPRRYGGLCLPVQEAMAAGLAVVMSDCPPNGWWPTLRVTAPARSHMDAPAGRLRLHTTSPAGLATALDGLATDPHQLRCWQLAAVGWAMTHTWEQLLPAYQRLLAEAADTV